MNLKHLSNNTLFQDTELLVKKERETLTQLLHHFKEIERRRLYATLQFGSLYDYLTIKLNYPKDQAWRRIQAMNLLKEIPEIEEQINSGSLSLTHMGMAQSFFKKQAKDFKKPYSKNQKLQVLERLENTSTREAERVVIDLCGQAPIEYREVIKSFSQDLTELRFVVPNETVNKIERLKGLRAHKNPGMTLGELIDQLCDLGLETWSPNDTPLLAAPRVKSLNPQAKNTHKPNESQSSSRRLVWSEAQGRCQNCKSVYALEIDHHRPKALGGSSTKDNLRLLCRSCNQRAAIEAFGLAKMERYLEQRD